MSTKLILDSIFLCIVAACAYSDLKKRIISNIAIACLFLLGAMHVVLILASGSSIIPNLFAIAAILPGLIAWQSGKIGGGDIKLMMGMGLYLGIWQLAIAFIGMLFPCLVLLLFRAIRKDKPARVPFAPLLFIGAIFPVAIEVLLSR